MVNLFEKVMIKEQERLSKIAAERGISVEQLLKNMSRNKKKRQRKERK